jgi:formylglycine-generating enzyme required for sulfatase activity
MIIFPAGQVAMGSPDWEKSHNQDEQMKVKTISRKFAISDREISQKQFEAFRRDSNRPNKNTRNFAPNANCAMIGVSWDDAVSFCRWLTKKAKIEENDQCYNDKKEWVQNGEYFHNILFRPERRGYRLATEAEWEYACRCGSTTAYSFGSDRSWLSCYAWNLDNSQRQVHPPAQLCPSPRGLFDMHGNIMEWCDNIYSNNYDIDESTPLQQRTRDRVLRGGGWSSHEDGVRSAFRTKAQPLASGSSYGFRIVRTIVENPPLEDKTQPKESNPPP